MTAYVIRRLIEGLFLLFIVSLILFTITYSLGDPVAALTDGSAPATAEEADRIRRALGLEDPLPLQYLYWLVGNDWTTIDADGDGDKDEQVYGQRRGILRGDLGVSLMTRQPAFERIEDRLPNTLLLMVPSYMIVLTVSLIVGLYSALRPYSAIDMILNGLAIIGFSMPIYFVCLALIFVFAVQFRQWDLPHLPIAGMWTLTEPRTPGNLISHMILPVASLTIVQSAVYIRYIRSAVLDVIREDYIRTARSKGLHERNIVLRHVLRPAALPIITLIGLDLPSLLGGAVVTESIFAWPGMGLLFIESLNRSDYTVLMGILIFISTAVILFQLLTDLVYTLVDPRVSYNGSRST